MADIVNNEEFGWACDLIKVVFGHIYRANSVTFAMNDCDWDCVDIADFDKCGLPCASSIVSD